MKIAPEYTWDRKLKKNVDEADESKPLSPMQLKFAQYICDGMTTLEAAKAAGKTPTAANSWGYKTIKLKKVRAIINEFNTRVATAFAEKAESTAEKMVNEVNEAIQFAKDNKQPAAYIKGLELKARLCGHLEKDKDTGSKFSINIIGLKDPNG